MDTKEKRDKIVAGISTALFFLALIGIIIIHDSNKSLEELLNGSKLKNENLLSEKLSSDKEVNKFKNHYASQIEKNKKLNKQLAHANALLSKKEKEIRYFSSNPKAKKLERELDEIRKLKVELELQLTAVNNDLQQQLMANGKLQGELATLTAKNEELGQSIDLIKAFANNYRLEASRGKNEKLTVVARRTKKLKMGFDLPQDIVENVQFKIKTPEGKVIDKQEDGLTAAIVDMEDGSDLVASVAPLGDFKVTKRIEMTYQPTKKLSKGVYVVDIYNGDTYLVSCQMRLR